MAKRAEMVETRRGKRRKQIFEGAVKVFAEKGFHAATTQEIANAAGLAKGTLYEYVRDKNEILLLVIEEAMSTLSNDIEKAIDGVDDPPERLKRTVYVQLNFAMKFRNAAKVLQHEIQNLNEEDARKHAELMNNQIDILKSIIDDGIKSGHFKKLNSRLAAELFIHTSTIYFGYGDVPYQKITLDEITDFIVDNFFQAIIRNDKK